MSTYALLIITLNDLVHVSRGNVIYRDPSILKCLFIILPIIY
jgi:hypothetical protein